MTRSRIIRVVITIIAMTGSLISLSPAPANDFPNFHGGPTHFAELPDGTSIAMNVVFPRNFDPNKQYPTIFESAGYENGSSSSSGRTMLGEADDYWHSYTGSRGNPPLAEDSHGGTSAFRYDDDYVSVHASVRGTGCSSGEFELFGWQIALDGKWIIDHWIPSQPWSNGKVAILGHSYSGMTGFMTAAAQPEKLVAVSVSGLIDDLYRAITYPGGVSNGGFPVLWTLGIRNAYDVLGGKGQAIARHKTDAIAQQCAKNIALQTINVEENAVTNGLIDTDGEWWRKHSQISYASLITKPIHIAGAWQDEQTGPRGFTHLWEKVGSADKRLVVTNGDHGTQVDAPEVWKDRKAFIDKYIGVANDFTPPAGPSVKTLFELHPESRVVELEGGETETVTEDVANGTKESTSWPLNDTSWTPYFLSAGGSLITGGAGSGGPDGYYSGSGRQSWSYQAGPRSGNQFTTPSGPDELSYVSAPLASDLAIAGPITANLFISSTAPDTELMVQLIDIGPDGSKTYLQRGVLRTSHDRVDTDKSAYSGTDPVSGGPFLYRPWRYHTDRENFSGVKEFLVEIFPIGHIVRKDHRIAIKVHSPSRVDSYYAYIPKTAPAQNTIHHSAAYPSRVTLPVVGLPTNLGGPIDCGSQTQVRCIAGQPQ